MYSAAKVSVTINTCSLQQDLTFSDMTSPPSFEPFAAARMALATELNRKDKNTIPTYDDYLNAVKFAPPRSDDIHFVPARPNSFNRGVLNEKGNQEPTEYNMHVDDNLYAEVGKEWMRWAMRCSIHALNIIMGSSDPDVQPNPTDFDKFI